MNYLLSMQNITKFFGSNKVLDNINFNVKHNEIHALIGENGAGKTTLISILFGLYQPTSGKIFLNNKETIISSPLKAKELKIGMVHQHFKLIDTFTVFENITLNYETTFFGFLKQKKDRQKIDDLCKQFNININLNKKISELNVIEKQQIEILKLLYLNPDILIFDEPTAILTNQQIEKFLDYLKILKKLGKTIILITHKLNEIKEVADSITIIRHGKLISSGDMKDYSTERISSLIVGESQVRTETKKTQVSENDIIFSCKSLILNKTKTPDNLLKAGFSNEINFEIKKNEILVLVGIENNGQEKLFDHILGFKKNKSNILLKDNIDISNFSIKKRWDSNISFISGDRHKYNVVLDSPIWENTILSTYHKNPYSKLQIINRNHCYSKTNEIIKKYDVRGTFDNEKTTFRNLSGGNQQKFVLGREMEKNNNLFCIVQPTRGLDIGATNNIHRLIIEQRNKGNSTLLISYDLSEVFKLADNVIVFYKGYATKKLNINSLTYQKIGLLMMGGS